MKRINIKVISLYLLIMLYVSIISILFVDKIISKYNLLINPISWFIFFLISIYICQEVMAQDKN